MSTGGPRRTLIVLVEDAPDAAIALEVALAAAGSFRVRTFASAEEALSLLRDVRPLAVVTDVHLPGISGLSLIEELKALYPGDSLKIIAVSGDGAPDLKNRALGAGADAFFAKPYSPREICRVLEEWIDEH